MAEQHITWENLLRMHKLMSRPKDAQIQQMQTPQPSYSAPAPSAARTDVTAQLQKLAQLHESGVLSDAEFAAAKQKLLGF